MGRTFSYSWSSSSRDSLGGSVSYSPRRDGRYGIPRKCICGGDMKIFTSAVDQGRRFYFCTGNTMDGNSHTRKWWDEAITEELQSVQENVADTDTRLNYMTEESEERKKFTVYTNELDVIRYNLQMVSDEIDQIKETIGDTKVMEKMKELMEAKKSPRKGESDAFGIKIAVISCVLVIMMTLIICLFKY